MMADRTVHARWQDLEIVRYDRAGKWYLESLPQQIKKRVSLDDAALRAAMFERADSGTVFYGLPGGTAFDRKVRGLA